MMIQYRFFGSAEGDTREYSQVEFAEILSRIFKNGYFPGVGDELQVTETNPKSMAVKVGSGEAWINGYWSKTIGKTLDIAPAHDAFKRIDRVVLRLDIVASRRVYLEIKQGVPSINPVAPELTRTTQVYELSLANIIVTPGAVSISTENIGNHRNNEGLCGIAIPYFAGEQLAKTLNANNNKITNVSNPASAKDAANKEYADTKVASTDVVTTPQPNKILRLNNSSKLPTSITGDAQSLQGYGSNAFYKFVAKRDFDGKIIRELETSLDTEQMSPEFTVRLKSENGNLVPDTPFLYEFSNALEIQPNFSKRHLLINFEGKQTNTTTGSYPGTFDTEFSLVNVDTNEVIYTKTITSRDSGNQLSTHSFSATVPVFAGGKIKFAVKTKSIIRRGTGFNAEFPVRGIVSISNFRAYMEGIEDGR